MTKTIPDHALVVVADGGKAILFRRQGAEGGTITLHEEKHLTQKTMQAEGPAGSRPDDQSPKQSNEAGFINHLAHVLHTMHQHGDYKHLVLVMDPQSLGQIRACLHKTVETVVVKSVAKDLTNHPLHAIEAALSD